MAKVAAVYLQLAAIVLCKKAVKIAMIPERAQFVILIVRRLCAAMGMRTTQPAKPATMVTTRRLILAPMEQLAIV